MNMRFSTAFAIIRTTLMTPAVILGLNACPQPANNPPTDAGDSSVPTPPPAPPSGVCAAACQVLTKLGCAEGTPTDCPASMQMAQDGLDSAGKPGLVIVPDSGGRKATCADLANAKTQADIFALGFNCTAD